MGNSPDHGLAEVGRMNSEDEEDEWGQEDGGGEDDLGGPPEPS